MKNVRPLGMFLFGALLAAACNGENPKQPLSAVSSPVALEDALLYTTSNPDEDSYQSLLLDLRGDKTRVVRAELPEGEAHSFARPGHEGEALILTAGAPARLEHGKGRDPVPSHVLMFDRSGEKRRFELSASYAALSVSDDGRYAIAHQPGGSWSTADSIAVIDLEQGDADQPVPATTVRALDGQGPSAVAFAPQGSPRRLAVLVMSDAINVLDLAHPERKDKVLPLKLPNGTGALRAKKVLFEGDHCFVQADTGSDIFAVRFEDSAGGFRASLSTFATESVVQDMALLAPEEGANGQRLLALGTNTLRLIDTKSGRGESSSTTMGFGSAALFVGSSPFDDIARPRALLYSEGSTRVGFVDLQADLVGSERGVEVLSLSGSIMKLALIESEGLAVALQSDARVSLIDLQERTVSALSAGDPLKELIVDQREGVARAWVLTANGTLGAIELGTRTASEVLLTRPARSVVLLPGATPRLVVGHDGDSGALTTLEAATPTRSTAHEVFGFLFTNYLD